MPGAQHIFKRDPNNKDQMCYMDHIEKQIKRGKLSPDCNKRVSIGRERGHSPDRCRQICIGKNAK